MRRRGRPVALLRDVPLAGRRPGDRPRRCLPFFFRLQAVGGPVYLSQIGYVAAAVGLFSGTLFLGESYRR